MNDANNTGTNLTERLRALDTATLYEAGARSTMTPEVRMLSGDRRLAGPALTVMCHPGDNLMIHGALQVPKPVRCWWHSVTTRAMGSGARC